MQFGTRVVTGAVAGAAILGAAPVGAVLGAVGAVIGTLGGAAFRGSLAKSFGKDPPAAFIEDAVAIGGGRFRRRGVGEMMKRFDAIVIGGGQAGPSLAGRLSAAGMTVAMIERKLFGGTCVNTGCMPTKTLVASARAAHVARRAADFGVHFQGPITVDMKRVRERANTVSTNARSGVEAWVKGMKNVTVFEGHGRFESAKRVVIGKEVIESDRVFINVGGRARIPQLPGVRQDPVPHEHDHGRARRAPRHLVVVGGSYIASSSRRCIAASAAR